MTENMAANAASAATNVNTTTVLKTYKVLASDKKQRTMLTKDKAVALFLVYILDDESAEIVCLALQILMIFTEKKDDAAVVSRWLGLTLVFDRLKKRALSEYIYRMIISIESRLQSAKEGPICAFENVQGRIREEENISKSAVTTVNEFDKKINNNNLQQQQKGIRFIGGMNKTRSVLLQFDPMTESDLKRVESALLKVKGVVSIYIDRYTYRCTVRAREMTTVETIASAVINAGAFSVHLVIKTDFEQEELIDMSAEKLNEDESKEYEKNKQMALPDYLPEDMNSSPKTQSGWLARLGSSTDHSNGKSSKDSGWLGQISSFLSNTLW